MAAVLASLLCIQGIFLGMKIASVIAWSWWTVFIPGYLFLIAIGIIAFIILYLVKQFSDG